jgi:RNA polymerase sigma-70 factor (family 1)
LIDYATYNDQELLRAIVSPEGDQRAFTVFYKRYADTVYESILYFLKDPLEAEEAVQELFARIWQKRTFLNIQDNVAGYLVMSCRNLVIDKLRKIKRDQTLLDRLRAVATSDIEDGSSMEAEALVLKQWELLQRAISKLPEQRRRVFELCKLEGKSYQEAADIMGIAVGTVSVQITKAKKDIQEQLRNQGELSVSILILLGLM